MGTKIRNKPIWLNVIRWTAKIVALVFVVILLFMFTGEDMSPFYRNAQLIEKNYLALSLWVITPIGYLIGLWKEGLGGLVSLISTFIHILLLPREFHNISIFIYLFISLLLIPGILYLVYWYFNNKVQAESNSTKN